MLKEHGYERRVDGVVPPSDVLDRPTYAFSWRHPDGFLVEIHQTLVGVRVPPATAWSILSRDLHHITVAKEAIPAFSVPARTLHLALHAAQHGLGVAKSLEDLRRGLAKEDIEVWRSAHRLAFELDAEDAFTNGLALIPAGKAALKELAPDAEPSLDVELHAAHARSSARSLEWFRYLSSGDRLRWLARKVAPSPAFMRLWHPLARVGRGGMALAYLWRPFWLLKELGLGLKERRRVQRELMRRDSSS